MNMREYERRHTMEDEHGLAKYSLAINVLCLGIEQMWLVGAKESDILDWVKEQIKNQKEEDKIYAIKRVINTRLYQKPSRWKKSKKA